MDAPPIPAHHADLIIPGLYLCDLHTAQDAKLALSLGITHIVSVLDFRPTFPDEMRDIERMHVRLEDSFREKITDHLDDTTAFIQEALENPGNKVLVHCLQGISRSATIVCAYLIAKHRMTGPGSIDFVRSKRAIVCPNKGFQRQLEEYAGKRKGKKRVIETQVRLDEAPKNVGSLKLWMRGIVSKKQDIGSPSGDVHPSPDKSVGENYSPLPRSPSNN